MQIVPVIDLMQGQVVRAVRGDRRAYRPIVSQLCGSSDPVTVAQALCRHVQSQRLYAADLDALMSGAVQTQAIAALLRGLPALELWLDAGFVDARALAALHAGLGTALVRRVVPVFGSESLRSATELAALVARGRDGWILSLDRRDGQRLDAAGCWDSPQHWPARVIVMTLERVGADNGPDLQTLRDVRARAPANTTLCGAGGIRDAGDLQAAAAAGAAGWLVASALHDGRLAPADAADSAGSFMPSDGS
jgi:phosphoribosylformimino-5-aminoimidazole carboxamide ribotide isomerase